MSEPLQPPVKKTPRILNDLWNDLDRVFKAILDRYYMPSNAEINGTPPISVVDDTNPHSKNISMEAQAANTINANATGGAAVRTAVPLAANQFLARSSAGNIEAKTLTDFALTILDDTTAAGVRTTIGAGTGNGTVTGVTGTAPIVSSGGAAPAISITAATTGAAGSMSATDKTLLDALNADKSTWTPTWTGFTLGNGTCTAYYKSSGHICRFRVDVTIGSTSSFAGTDVYFRLPVQGVGMTDYAPLGLVNFYDPGLAVYNGAGLYLSDTPQGHCSIRCVDASGTYAKNAWPTSTIPFAWAAGDKFMAEGWYFV